MAPLSMQNATAAISCVPTIAHDGTVLCSWSDNPSFRGTLNVLWLCGSTLGLCVWNAVHPDVPYPGTPKWRVIGKRIWWLVVGLFMPEMLVLTALGQFRQAYSLLIRVGRETRVPTELPWWARAIERLRATPPTAHEPLSLPLSRDEVLSPNLRTRAVSPPLPSLELEDAATSLPSPAPDTLPPAPGKDAGTEHATEAHERQHAWTLTHSFYAIMHGFISAEGDAFWTTQEEEDGGLMPVFDLDNAVKRIGAPLGDALSIPDMSASDLNDRSKAGIFAKSLLVWQFSVFVANCVARWNQRLPLSLLEITTLAHSLCSLLALALWWYKPHSVGEAIVIDQTRSDSLPPPRLQMLWSNIINRAGSTVLPGKHPITLSSAIAILAITALYGLPHLLGLSVHFPTSVEQLCWKLATLVVIGGPLVICYSIWIMDLDETENIGCMEGVLMVLFLVLVPLYPVANMFIVGESVRQVFALPEGSFHEPQLTRYLPSFS